MQRRTLTRSSIASLIATGAEFAALPVLIHLLAVPHWVSYAAVQVLANLISFLLYKYWAFDCAHHGSLRTQYLRQLVVFSGSWALNTAIPSLLSYRLHVPPVLAFAISNVIVYLAWNYPNRFWVFRQG